MSGLEKLSRREFLQKSVAGTAAAGLAITSTSHVTAQTVPDAAEPEVTNEVDVLVVGGGPAGIGATIGAARTGADTLVLERFQCLGGMLSGAVTGIDDGGPN